MTRPRRKPLQFWCVLCKDEGHHHGQATGAWIQYERPISEYIAGINKLPCGPHRIVRLEEVEGEER